MHLANVSRNLWRLGSTCLFKNLRDTTPDENVDKVWKHCTKCKCLSATGKQGIYQLSHFDHYHVDNFQGSSGNHTPLADPASIPAGPPSVTMSKPSDTSLDEDDLAFTGIWCTPVQDPTRDPVITTVVHVLPPKTMTVCLLSLTDLKMRTMTIRMMTQHLPLVTPSADDMLLTYFI